MKEGHKLKAKVNLYPFLTKGNTYTMSYSGFSCCIKDNFGASKIYYTDNIWFKKNFKVMKKSEYILWSRSIKIKKLDLI